MLRKGEGGGRKFSNIYIPDDRNSLIQVLGLVTSQATLNHLFWLNKLPLSCTRTKRPCPSSPANEGVLVEYFRFDIVCEDCEVYKRALLSEIG